MYLSSTVFNKQQQQQKHWGRSQNRDFKSLGKTDLSVYFSLTKLYSWVCKLESYFVQSRPKNSILALHCKVIFKDSFFISYPCRKTRTIELCFVENKSFVYRKVLGTGPSDEKKQRNIEAGSNSVNKKQKEIKVNI